MIITIDTEQFIKALKIEGTDEYREAFISVGEFQKALKIAEVKQSEWISVEERLPEKDGKYLVYDLGQHRGISAEEIRITYFKKGDKYHDYMWRNHFSHWMPIPEVPKTEGEGR